MHDWKYFYNITWCSGYPQRSSWGVPTASDELYSCSGWRPRVESKLIIESGMGIRPQDRLDDISSAQPIWLRLGRYDLMQSKPWQATSMLIIAPWKASVLQVTSKAVQLMPWLQFFIWNHLALSSNGLMICILLHECQWHHQILVLLQLACNHGYYRSLVSLGIQLKPKARILHLWFLMLALSGTWNITPSPYHRKSA